MKKSKKKHKHYSPTSGNWRGHPISQYKKYQKTKKFITGVELFEKIKKERDKNIKFWEMIKQKFGKTRMIKLARSNTPMKLIIKRYELHRA